METLKHKKIEEIMRSHQEKSPRKRRRSREEENNPSPFKNPRYLGGAKADHITAKADPSLAKPDQSSVKADPSSRKPDPGCNSVIADPTFSKADPSNTNMKKSATKSTPARKSTRTPAKKYIQAKQAPKVSKVQKRTSNLISYFENLPKSNLNGKEKTNIPNSSKISPSKLKQLKIPSSFYLQTQKVDRRSPKHPSATYLPKPTQFHPQSTHQQYPNGK